MPATEHPAPQPIDIPLQDIQQPQFKVCTTCHSQVVVDPATTPAHPDTATVCARCRDHSAPQRTISHIPEPHIHCVDYDVPLARQHSQPPSEPFSSPRRRLDVSVFQADAVMDTARPDVDVHTPQTHLSHLPSFPNKHAPQLTIQTADITPKHVGSSTEHSVTVPPSNGTRRTEHRSTTLDPLTDITRLRMRSQTHRCLYPGATFQGTQKSGRNSYDVNVTIVDVDFASSFLCGYLCIRGLTDDWPELTTYFDAEIIGSRYGFLTRNWGANEAEDIVHWSRFPAFRHVKNELRKPYLTMCDRDRGAVFMRWKERFLVPDHRVQDINGASFAGFYYVCVDFNPPSSSSSRSPLSATPEEEMGSWPPSGPDKPEPPARRRRDSSVHRGVRSSSAGREPPVATMSGFYFHQNSEPYQQLSLCHVPERTSTSFEFR